MKNHEYIWEDEPGSFAFPVAKAGHPVIIGCAFITLIFALIQWKVLTLITLLITIGICLFFRDPDRIIPNNDSAIVSPADGKVIFADIVDNSILDNSTCYKISIFMSVLNVHVNRIPYNGTIKDIMYTPGKFFSANLDKASEKNEQSAMIIEYKKGKEIGVVQIAGLIARRIICNVQTGDKVRRGSRYGMICFGSRLDVYLPSDVKINVKRGDKVHAGFSIIGVLT